MKPFRTFPNKSKQRGNVFAMLFAAVALTGVLAAVGMQTLTGPVTTVTRVTQRNVADTQLLMNAKIIVNAAITGVADGDADGDGLIEPSAYVSPSGGETAPVNGGFLPTDLGLSLTDPWGTRYGYCVWDHGTTNTSANRLTGDNTASAPTQIVLAIIAAGPDKTFQTTCSAFSGGLVQVTKAGGADDLHFKYTYAEASANSNGLWSINVSDQAKAELKNAAGSQVNVTIDRDTGVGDFLGLTTGVISAKTAETIAMDGALLLDAAGATSDTCTAAEKGSIRLNAGLDSIEICDGAGGFFDLTPAYWEASGNDIYATNTGNVGIGTPSPSQKLDVQGNTNISANIVAGGTGAIGGDFTVNTDALAVDAANKRVGIGKSPDEALDVIGNAAIDGSAAVTGGLTVDTETLAVDADGDMVGIGTASPEHRLDIAGGSDMGALGSMETADAVLHIDDGTANLYADGRAIISDAGLILGTTGANGLQLVTNEAQRILIADDGTVSITGNTGISGAVNLWSTLNVTGIANFDSGTLYVDVPDSRVGIGTTDPLTKLDVTGGIKIGGDTLCNISKAGMVAWNSGVLQLCGADGNWTSLAAIEKLDDIGDVDVPSPNNDDVLAWNGTNWVAKNIALLGPADVNPAGNDGSIQFRDGNDLGADPDYLHWDKDNHRLGIGTSSPAEVLHLASSGGNARILFQTAGGPSDLHFRRANSTLSSPSSVVANNRLFGLMAFGYGQTQYSASERARIEVIATENWTDSAQGTHIRFQTTEAGTTTTAVRMLIGNDGNVGIGTQTPQSKLHVAGGIQLGDDTASCPGASNVKLGTLRFNGGNLQVCKSSGWSGVGTGSGTAPAFSVNRNGTNQTVTASTEVKIDFTNKDFDVTGAFDLAGDRFTPQTPGKYIFTASAYCPSATNYCQVFIRKNGSFASVNYARGDGGNAEAQTTAIIDMNGTTDYVEASVLSAPGTTISGATYYTYFTGALLGGESGGSEGGGSGGASSMLPGWPDAFMCQVSGKPYIYWLVADNGTQVIYRLLRNTAGDTYIRFNPSTKAFVDTNDAGQAGDCAANSWSIDDLYAQGRAFNFVGGGGGGGTNVGFMAARSGASQSLTGSAWSQVILPTEIRDDGGDNYDPATGIYTVPQTGYYSVYGRAVVSGTGGTASYILIDYDNNTSNQACYSSNQGDSSSYYISCAGIVHLTAGQALRLKYWYSGTSPSTSNAEFRAVLLNAGSGGDTLAGLSCASGEIPKWNGTAWECAADGGGSGGATTIFSNASGALRYAVFNGVSGATVYKSGGVSDIIRTGTGDYTVKWTTPFADDNYIILGSCNPNGYSGARFSIEGNRISGHQYESVHPSQAGITCRKAADSGSVDSDLVVVVAFDLNSPYVEAGASFNGSGSATVYAQKGVSSITRTSAGRYTVTWSTPFPDNKYVVLGSCNGWGTSGAAFTVEGNNIVGHQYEGLKTGSTDIGCRNPSLTDSDLVHVVAVRLGEGFAKKGAVFNGTSGVSNTVYSGVSSVSRVSAGLYDANWSTPFASEDYVVLGSCNARGTSGLIMGARSKAYNMSAAKARVECRDSSNGTADTDYGAVVAFDPTTDDIGDPAGGASDTLANLSCNAGELAKWNGSEWACAEDGGGGSGSSESEVSFVASGAANALTNATWTDLTGWTEINEKGGDNFDASTGKFTAPSDGTYMFSASLFTSAGATGAAGVMVQTDAASAGGTQICYSMRPNGTVGNVPSCSGAMYLTAGQIVEMIGYQQTGGTVNPVGNRVSFSGFKVSGGGDTLAGLSCVSGQIPKWNGSEWACAAAGGGSGGEDMVAFFAKDSSTNLPAATWADVVFSNEVLDAGGDNYNPATGKFTAPSDGMYQFSANINFGSLTNERGLIIQKADPGAAGDNRVCTSYLNSNATATTYTANCSGSIYLTAGDQVEVTARDNPGSNLAGELRNTFSGFKVGSGGGTDTLSGLSCASGEIPKWNGSAWACSEDGGGGGGSALGTPVGRSMGTEYTADSDGLFLVSVRAQNTAGAAPNCQIQGLVDGTVVAMDGGRIAGDGANTYNSMSMTIPVKSGQTYEAIYNTGLGGCVTGGSYTYTEHLSFHPLSGGSGGGKFIDGDDSDNAVYMDGDVGVGTTTPSTPLEVVGTIKAASGLLWSADGSTSLTRNLLLENYDDTANASGLDVGVKLGGTEFQGLSWLQETAWTSASAAADKDVMLQLGVLSDNTPANPVVIRASGAVGIGTDAPAASALVDITSTEKGFLPPRMTKAQRDAITSPAEGLMIYNTTDSRIEYFNGSDWAFFTMLSATNPFRYCTENQNCGGTPVLCKAVGGGVNGVYAVPYSQPSFGSWSNTQCGLSGSGWSSSSMSSCGTGAGTKRVRCDWVVVENELDGNYPIPDTCTIANGFGVEIDGSCLAAACDAGFAPNTNATACE